MKKSILLMLTLLFSLCIGFISCNGCKGEKNIDKQEVVKGNDANGVLAELNVENLISTDRQGMFLKYNNDSTHYRWYETCIRLNDFLDEDPDGSIEIVTNIFQVIIEIGNGADTYVYKSQYFAGKHQVDSIHGFWMEDEPLNDKPIKLTYKQAFERAMQSNAVKPHSKNCILRCPVGPKEINAQYVFGNLSEQIWVDAVTGDVRTSNPAFDKVTIKKPLGEWP